jgi:hypothetical protein
MTALEQQLINTMQQLSEHLMQQISQESELMLTLIQHLEHLSNQIEKLNSG